MSDPEVPRSDKRPEQQPDVDHVVDSANAGLADAAAAGADVPGSASSRPEDDPASHRPADESAQEIRPTDDRPAPVDPDLAAFEEAERAHPGTFGSAYDDTDSAAARQAADRAAADYGTEDHLARRDDSADREGSGRADRPDVIAEPDPSRDVRASEPGPNEAVTSVHAPADRDASAPTVATTAYAPHEHSDDETRIIPSEPVAAPSPQPQPIFVQAPEPPEELNNRAAAAGIGLLATLVFAILYLGTVLGLSAAAGDVTTENIGEAALAPLTTWGFWVPVVAFFIGFWLLGAIVNRGRWGLWVIFGIIVGLIAYGGHILGQLFEAPFWNLTAGEGSELVSGELLAPLAIAAFVFGRELTIWFGAWVARSGARKNEINAEAQREYERTLEAGPTLSR